MENPSFDWCSFFSLFYSDTGIKCKINIPDTVLFRYGQLSAWWATNKEGYIQRHTSQSTSIEGIRKRFLAVASEDASNYSKYVSISRLGDGKPQLLRVMAFNQLCELLSDRLESGHPDEAPEIETPSVLQAFIQPYQDLRYITTYINAGTTVACHTFQRKYSRRYTAMSAASAAQVDARDADIILSVDADGDARRAAIDAQQGAVEPALKMQLRKLTAHLVKYIERAHGLTLGGIVCEYIRDADGKVYLISVLRTEWSSNASGHGAGSLAAAALLEDPRDLTLPGDEQQQRQQDYGRDEEDPEIAAQLAAAQAGAGAQGRGEGAPPLGQQRMGSFAHWSGPGTEEVPGGSGGALTAAMPRPNTAAAGGGPRPASRAGEPLQPTTTNTTARSAHMHYPGGPASVNALKVNVTNTWPSATHDQALSPTSPSATIPRSVNGEASGMYSVGASPGGTLRARSARPTTVGAGAPMSRPPPRPTSSPSRSTGGVRSSSPTAVPGGAPLGFGSTTHRSTFVSPDRPYSSRGGPGAPINEFPPVAGGVLPPHMGALTSRGEHVNAGPRGAPLLVSQLQKEVEMLRDQLIYQHELAEANAAKVRQLEREKSIVTGTFDQRSNELQHLLASTREELDQTRALCDSWRQRAEEAEAKTAELGAERVSLSDTIASERGTTLSALREYQERDARNSTRIEQLETEVNRLTESLRMETTVVNSLKRQLLEFSEIAERHKNTLRDTTADPSTLEVLDRTAHLLSSQTNPTGEQYAVQKILHHYQPDLRAVFLFYAQLEHSFTDHWPPSMNFAQWMLFCKDSETSDTRAGARIRSNQHFKMLHPHDCENLFTKYSQPDETAKTPDPVFSYESYLSALIHVAEKLRRSEVPSLSEGLREYILRYLSKAHRVSPQGMKRGAVRQALGGHDAAGVISGGTGGEGGSYMEHTARSAAYAAATASGRTTPVGATHHGGSRLSSQGPGGSSYNGGGAGDPGSPDSRPWSGEAGSPGGKKKRVKSAAPKGARTPSSRPMSAASSVVNSMASGKPLSPARVLHDAGNSAVLKELALLSLAGPNSNSGQVMRTGGGFSVA